MDTNENSAVFKEENIRFWDKAIAVAKSFSLRPVVFSTSCCTYEIDLALNSASKLDKIGISELKSDFTKADLFIISGCMNEKFMKVIHESYCSSITPKYVIAVGDCACDGNIFEDKKDKKKLDDVIPVDVYIRGCSPSQDKIISEIITLQSKIRSGYVRKLVPEDAIEEFSYDIPSIIQHGFSMNISATGNSIEELTLETGFSYRGLEDFFKGKAVVKSLPFLEKIDYLSPIAGPLIFMKNIEKGLQINVPEKRDFIEAILSELMRISSHLRNFSNLIKYFGKTSLFKQVLTYESTLRDIILRFNHGEYRSFFLPGGTAFDIDEDILKDIRSFVESLPPLLKLIKKKVFGSTLILSQLDSLGRIRKKHALDFSLSGPNLRATGINMDCRKDVEFYKKFNFKPVLGRYGDAKDRFYVRFEEMVQSVDFISQFVSNMPEGSTRVEVNEECVLNELTISPNHHSMEFGKGELGISLTVDRGKISSLKINDPSYYVTDMINQSYCDIDLDAVELNLISFDIEACGVDK